MFGGVMTMQAPVGNGTNASRRRGFASALIAAAVVGVDLWLVWSG
jgi:hypothetical protein